MLKLIINGDDFGLTEGCNQVIVKAMAEGMLTDTTIMINEEKSCHAVELAKAQGISRIGLHLNLTCGKPVLGEKVKSLTDENGIFYRRSNLLLPVMKLEEAKQELWAQVERFRAFGIGLTHIDSHHHIHRFDGLAELFIDIAKKLNVPLRQIGEPVRAKIEAAGVKTTEHFSMEFYDQKATFQSLVNILEGYDSGVLEMMTHPGIADEELRAKSSYCEPREKELEVLTSLQFKEYMEERKIKLISFNDLV